MLLWSCKARRRMGAAWPSAFTASPLNCVELNLKCVSIVTPCVSYFVPTHRSHTLLSHLFPHLQELGPKRTAEEEEKYKQKVKDAAEDLASSLSTLQV